MRKGSMALMALMSVVALAGCGVSAGIPPSSSPTSVSSQGARPSPSKETSHPSVSGQKTSYITSATANATIMHVVYFLNSQRGFLAGLGGIWKTQDGGRKWVVVSHDAHNFQGMQFVNSQTGWAWNYQTILQTTNGGNSWKSLYRGTVPIISVSFTGTRTGYAVIGTPSAPTGPGEPGNALYRTDDGGAHWNKLSTPFHPMAVAFSGPNYGWAVGHSQVWKTIDGGNKWMPVYHYGSATPMAAQIKLAGLNNVWVLLQGGSGMNQTAYTVIHGNSGGKWEVVAAKSTAGAGPAPDAPTGAPDAPGLAPGPWTVVNSSTVVLGGVSPAANLGTTAIWLTKNSGHSWNQYSSIYGANGVPGPSALSFVSPKRGWLIDGMNNTQVLETTNGGVSWHQIFPSPDPVAGISFVGKSTGYGLGAPGHPNQIVVTHNAGRTWSSLARLPLSPAPQYDYPGDVIDFTSRSTGWAMRNNGLWKTENGGKTWSGQTLPDWTSQDFLNQVDFVGQDGVAGSPLYNYCWWTVNGGRTWNYAQHESFVQALTNMNRGIHQEIARVGKNPVQAEGFSSTLWILFENGAWALSANNGQSWTLHPASAKMGYDFNDLSFVNGSDGWAENSTGSLWQTANGGRSWQKLP